jgi:hypothetical protein
MRSAEAANVRAAAQWLFVGKAGAELSRLLLR